MKAALSAGNKAPEPEDSDYEERKKTYVNNPNVDKILAQLKGNTNIIFTNGDLTEIKAIKAILRSPKLYSDFIRAS